jgi:hypothetical protein
VSDVEPVEAFRARARAWLAANMPPECDELGRRGDPDRWQVERELHRRV